MARYREKTQDDLDWNKIRRRINTEVNCVLADIGEEVKNIALSEAFRKYSKALSHGAPLPQVESDYAELVRRVLEDKVPRLLEAVGVGDDDAPVD